VESVTYQKVNEMGSDNSPEAMALIAFIEFMVAIVADWYTIVLTGVIILFFVPVIILILFYAIAVFLYAYKRSRRNEGNFGEHFWNSARLSVCTFLVLLAKYWHAHEVVGMENIPNRGPALLCMYHGSLPVDVYYLLAKLQLYKKRRLKIIVDHFLFKMPGLKNLLEVFRCFTGPASECVRTLRKGHLLAIYPGGVREALFSGDNYELQWNKRTGFAKVALAARVPIIPIFTTNCQESFKVVKTGQGFARWLYEKTKFPFVLYYGGFPVKMKTVIGPKIEYDTSMTPEEVSTLCQEAIRKLIKEHQTLPGSVVGGLKDRWMPSLNKRDFKTIKTD